MYSRVRTLFSVCSEEMRFAWNCSRPDPAFAFFRMAQAIRLTCLSMIFRLAGSVSGLPGSRNSSPCSGLKTAGLICGSRGGFSLPLKFVTFRPKRAIPVKKAGTWGASSSSCHRRARRSFSASWHGFVPSYARCLKPRTEYGRVGEQVPNDIKQMAY